MPNRFGQLLVLCLLALGTQLSSPSAVMAEEAEAGDGESVVFGEPAPPAAEAPAAAETPAASPADAAETGEDLPWLTEQEIQTPTPIDEIRCPQVRCRCDEEGDAGCESLTCHCERLGDTSSFGDDEGLVHGRELAAEMQVPVPVSGFTLQAHRLALRVETSFPFLETALLIRLHERVTLGLGYRSFYGFNNAGIAELAIQVAQNESHSRGMSIIARGGYGRNVDPQEPWHTAFTGYNGPLGELLIAGTFRWGRHAFDLNMGVRIGGVPERDCEDEWDDYCYDAWFRNGESKPAVTMLADFGWSLRFMERASFFAGLGVHWYTNSDAIPALPRFRAGFIFEL